MVMSLDVKIEEEYQALLLLCSLPGMYDGLITTLVYKKETLNYEEVVGMLRLNEQWEKIYKGNPNSKVHVVHKRQGRPRKKSRRNPRIDHNLGIIKRTRNVTSVIGLDISGRIILFRR